MGDAIKKQFDADVEYIAGSGGVLVVTVDGKEIFSKAESKRFPETDELIRLINAL
ncbi:MAG: Rdx family protein [Desulfobulbaceae bacterium]|nr:Rdx family protein [Desulfobulbaceae bacterium]MCK5436576.1 Rdx family protein [Desulfobulbaceae bacterium]